MRRSWLVASAISLLMAVAACATPGGEGRFSSEELHASNLYRYAAASDARLVIDDAGAEAGIHLWDTDLTMGIEPCPGRPRCVITPIGTFAEIGPADSALINGFSLRASRDRETTTVFAYADGCAGACYRYAYDDAGLSELEWLDPSRFATLTREGAFVAQGARYRIGGHPE